MLERQKRLNEVYEHLHQHCGVHTKGHFADSINYARAYISSALNGNEKYLTDKLFTKICEAYPDTFSLDVTVSSRDADNDIMGRAVISSVPFKRNRVTEYSGNLFSAGGGMSVSLDDTWEQSYTGT